MQIDDIIEALSEKATKLLLDRRVSPKLKEDFITKLTEIEERAKKLQRFSTLNQDNLKKAIKLRILVDFISQAEKEIAKRKPRKIVGIL